MGDKIIYNITELSDAELGACKELLDYLDEDTRDDNIDFLFDMGIVNYSAINNRASCFNHYCTG